MQLYSLKSSYDLSIYPNEPHEGLATQDVWNDRSNDCLFRKGLRLRKRISHLVGSLAMSLIVGLLIAVVLFAGSASAAGPDAAGNGHMAVLQKES